MLRFGLLVVVVGFLLLSIPWIWYMGAMTWVGTLHQVLDRPTVVYKTQGTMTEEQEEQPKETSTVTGETSTIPMDNVIPEDLPIPMFTPLNVLMAHP